MNEENEVCEVCNMQGDDLDICFRCDAILCKDCRDNTEGVILCKKCKNIDKALEEALVSICCPFCDEEILRAYDHSMLPAELSEEEREEITINTLDETDGICEHLAFRSDWAYSGSEFIPKWQQQMEKLAISVSGKTEDNDPEVIAAALMHDRNLYPCAAEALSDYFFECTCNYVEKFDGVSQGGPTYMHIFLKEK